MKCKEKEWYRGCPFRYTEYCLKECDEREV